MLEYKESIGIQYNFFSEHFCSFYKYNTKDQNFSVAQIFLQELFYKLWDWFL